MDLWGLMQKLGASDDGPGTMVTQRRIITVTGRRGRNTEFPFGRKRGDLYGVPSGTSPAHKTIYQYCSLLANFLFWADWLLGRPVSFSSSFPQNGLGSDDAQTYYHGRGGCVRVGGRLFYITITRLFIAEQ